MGAQCQRRTVRRRDRRIGILHRQDIGGVRIVCARVGEQINRERERLVLWALDKNRKYKNFDAALRNWLLKCMPEGSSRADRESAQKRRQEEIRAQEERCERQERERQERVRQMRDDPSRQEAVNKQAQKRIADMQRKLNREGNR